MLAFFRRGDKIEVYAVSRGGWLKYTGQTEVEGFLGKTDACGCNIQRGDGSGAGLYTANSSKQFRRFPYIIIRRRRSAPKQCPEIKTIF
ncbi:MAG: hypothetical protein DRP56_06780 [Planctomycetota bacterium]|nr:MAG: hypothetical protein DRP56_06780 [Planctomycetota bacterium]